MENIRGFTSPEGKDAMKILATKLDEVGIDRVLCLQPSNITIIIIIIIIIITIIIIIIFSIIILILILIVIVVVVIISIIDASHLPAALALGRTASMILLISSFANRSGTSPEQDL